MANVSLKLFTVVIRRSKNDAGQAFSIAATDKRTAIDIAKMSYRMRRNRRKNKLLTSVQLLAEVNEKEPVVA